MTYEYVFQQDLLAGRGSVQLRGHSGIFHVNGSGTYVVKAMLYMHPFGEGDEVILEGILASGVTAINIPIEWAE